MNPFDHSEEDAIKTLLEETAGQIKPSSAFTANLEKQLKQAHKPKASLNMSTLKKITTPIGWGLALIALAFGFNWIASQIAPKNIPASSNPDFICPVTPPNGSLPPGEIREDLNYLGNDILWTALAQDGKIYMTADDQLPDGSFRIKWPWWWSYIADDPLTVEGQRLDAEAEPLDAQITEADTGYMVASLTFPTIGCWEITGSMGNTSLTFVTEVIFNQPAPFLEESTPVTTASTPAGQVYQWNGQSVYLNTALPEVSPEMKIYLTQDEIPASVEDVQTLGEKFGMQGDIYPIQGEVPETTNYLMVDGDQRLYVRSDRYFIYYPSYADSMYSFDTKENPDAESLIAEFMRTRGFETNYKLEHSSYFGGYIAIPLTPDGFIIRHEHFTVNGFIFEFNENGIVRVRASVLRYDEAVTAQIISAEEALSKLLINTGLSYGVLSGMHSAVTETSSWIRTRPLDQPLPYYAVLSSTGKSITGGAPLITLDGYRVTGSVQNIPENMPNTFVKATGQFHEANGIKTFELESWSDYTGYEEGYVGTILKEGNQTFLISAEGNKLKIADLPADLPLPAENIFTTGVTHDGEFDWKSIDDRATSGGGGGGGGSSGFYQLNLSGTPMPLPTAIPLQTPTLDVHRFEKQRGIPRIMVFTQADGSQRTEYRFASSDPDYPYVLLEGENLEVLQAHNNRPVDIWGAVDHFDEYGNIVVKVEKFEIPFPDLEFQILKGTEKPLELEGKTALLFTAEDGQSYIHLSTDCYNVVGPELMGGTGENGELLLIEALIVPDVTIAGYPTVCVFSISPAVNTPDGSLNEMTITADQLEVVDDSLFSPMNPPTLSIEKVELAYFTPDMRYAPASEQVDESPYLQPVWIFSGHYSDGSEFEFIVQALKDEYLSPQVQPAHQPG